MNETVFPEDVMYTIFQYLSHKDLASASLVHSTWRNTIVQNENSIYSTLLKQNFSYSIPEEVKETKVPENSPKSLYKKIIQFEMKGTWSLTTTTTNSNISCQYKLNIDTVTECEFSGSGTFPAQHYWTNPIPFTIAGKFNKAKGLSFTATIIWDVGFGQSELKGKLDPVSGNITGEWYNSETQYGGFVGKKE